MTVENIWVKIWGPIAFCLPRIPYVCITATSWQMIVVFTKKIITQNILINN